MKRVLPLIPLLALGACAQAPDIADWPPKAPAVDDATVQRYVDIYAHKEPVAPVYTPEELDALNLLNRRMLRNDTPDGDIEKLRRELEEIRAAGEHDDEAEPRGYSRNEINAIKRRIERRYESKHDQRMALKRYGL
ncbi:MAG: hypothetical protein JJ900_06640 [Rhodospirillales bacterium]|nr:hypothetical protein [Rhodospirillales bacterium]MBO6786514.1 hypothetical protein [Rhodospirillales bacterium]